MKTTLAIMALLGSASAFLGDEAPVWEDSKLMKDAKSFSEGDEKFARFMAFEKNRKAGKDDYTYGKPLEFVQPNEEENKKQGQAKLAVSAPPPTVAPQSTPIAAPGQLST